MPRSRRGREEYSEGCPFCDDLKSDGRISAKKLRALHLKEKHEELEKPAEEEEIEE